MSSTQDPISTNLQAVYAKWEQRGPRAVVQNENPADGKHQIVWNQAGQLADKISQEGKLKWRDRFGDNIRPMMHRKSRQRNRKPVAVPAEVVTTNVIAQFKKSPIITPESLIVQRPFMGRVCSCMPQSQVDFITTSTAKCGFRNLLDLEIRGRNWKEKYFSNLVYTLRRRNTYRYPDVTSAVLESPRVSEVIAQETENSGDEKAVIKLRGKAKHLLDVMKSKLSGNLVGFIAWLLTKLFPSMLRTVLVHKGQIEMVKKASERGLPVIYLPLHRSHLDYILVTFICWHFKIKAPYVAAGINLNIPFFGSLMKGLGGFFIRRKLDKYIGKKDHMYRAVLHSYMQELLKKGESMEFFIEGGRSRSGKTYIPKGGLLSVIVDTLSNGLIEDAYIVPISISYEKLVDGNFCTEQLGLPKKPETFFGAVKALWKAYSTNYGSVRVDFSQPFSLKEYLQNTQVQQVVQGSDSNSDSEVSVDSVTNSLPPLVRSMGSCTSLYGTDIVVEEQRQNIKTLAEHITFTSSHCTALMCTNVLAFLLLNKHRKGVEKDRLVADFDWLLGELKSRKRDVGFTGESESVIHYASLILGDNLVSRVPDVNSNSEVYKPNTELPGLLELSYYSNAVLSAFALESALSCAIIYHCNVSFTGPIETQEACSASREDILETALEICQLLKYEFIFVSPCKRLDEVLADELDQMVSREIIQFEDSLSDDQYATYEKGWARRLSANMAWEDEDDEDFHLQQMCRVNTKRADCMEKIKFLHCVLAPLLETYYVTACQIDKSLKSESLENDFLKHVHNVAKERVHNNVASYGESVVLDSLKNSLKSFDDLKIIDIYCVGNLRMVELHDHFEVRSKLNKYIELLEALKD